MNQRTAVQGRMGPGGQPTGPRPAVVVPNRYREQPPRTGWYALAAFFALVALGLGGFLLFNTLTGGEKSSEREMKNYIGQPLAEVVADLTELRIPYIAIEEEDPDFGDGIVHRTTPEAGVVISGSAPVEIYHNATDATSVVPGLEGMSVEDARARLADEGFVNIVAQNENGDPVDSGTVLRTEPGEGNEIPVDDQVTIVVSNASGAIESSVPETTEPGSFQVPHLIGDGRQSAIEQLEEAGLEVQINVIENAPEQWDGKVMDQSPRSPTMVSEGDTVTINVGDAPDEPATTQPPATNPPADQPAGDQPAGDQPAGDQPAGDSGTNHRRADHHRGGDDDNRLMGTGLT